MKNSGDQKELRAERLSRLIRTEQDKVVHSRTYTRFVKAMRFALPVAALVIIVVVMAWPRMEQSITPITPENVAQNQQPVTQNELINPRFEGADSQNNPYVITAERAVQSTQNPDILLLDKPAGDIKMKSSEMLIITADKGNYRQNAGKLMLDGNVKLKHSNGYDMVTTRLMIDVKAQETRTDQDVRITGPAGTLEATGLDARNSDGLIIFTGPAKLVLKESLKGL